MRKLAIALGVSAAVLIAGGIAWKADASGTLNLPGRAGSLLWVGTVPARILHALQYVAVLVQALLVQARRL